jgi:hypothetical protein
VNHKERCDQIPGRELGLANQLPQGIGSPPPSGAHQWLRTHREQPG